MSESRQFFNDVSNLIDHLRDSELAVFTNPVTLTPTQVTWAASGTNGSQLVTHSDADEQVLAYRRWVEAGDYSAVLTDGSLLQITYGFRNGVLDSHRLAYVPSPLQLDLDLLLEWAFVDVIDVALGNPLHVMMR